MNLVLLSISKAINNKRYWLQSASRTKAVTVKNKIALATGGNLGLGFETCRQLDKTDYDVSSLILLDLYMLPPLRQMELQAMTWIDL